MVFSETSFVFFSRGQKEQAEFLLKIGAVKAALDVFLRLELWEEVIKCYKTLGQTEKVFFAPVTQVLRQQCRLLKPKTLCCEE